MWRDSGVCSSCSPGGKKLGGACSNLRLVCSLGEEKLGRETNEPPNPAIMVPAPMILFLVLKHWGMYQSLTQREMQTLVWT